MSNEELFDMFWQSGIYKTKKKDARKTFLKLIEKQPNKTDFVQMLCDDIKLRLKINQFGFSGLHPTTYLNGERWEDEIREGDANGQDRFEQPRKQTPAERASEQARWAIDRAEQQANQVRRGFMGKNDPAIPAQMGIFGR